MPSKLLKFQLPVVALRENKDFPGISSLSANWRIVPVFQFLFVFLISYADLLHIIF